MNDFVTWGSFGSYAGTVTMTTIITQFLKKIPGVNKMNAQLLAFIVAVILLEATVIFKGEFRFDTAIIAIVNAVIVALAANGTYDVFVSQPTKPVENKEEVNNG